MIPADSKSAGVANDCGFAHGGEPFAAEGGGAEISGKSVSRMT